MARNDKVEPLSGSHRAPLNADWLAADYNKVVPVSLNAAGKVVKGTAGQSGFIGVVCITGVETRPGSGIYRGARFANDIVDVMQDGEIVELTGLAAGTKYYAAADGNGINTTATNPLVGWTVEAGRLIVRCKITGGAA